MNKLLHKSDVPTVELVQCTSSTKCVGQAFQPAETREDIWQPLQTAELASIEEEILWHHHGERYILDANVIMPDHVHLLIMPLPGWPLSKILPNFFLFPEQAEESIGICSSRIRL